MKKLTLIEFIDKCNHVHKNKYNYSKVTYVNGKTKIIIICPEHGEFKQLAGNHSKGQGCAKCHHKILDVFIEQARKIHSNFYNYESTIYLSSKKKVIITCPIHGDFGQLPTDHLKDYGCSKCSNKNKPTNEEWVKSAKEIHHEYNYSKVFYVDNKTPVEVICPKHGSFYPLPNNHILKKTKCPKCNDDIKHKKYKKSTEQFILDAERVHNKSYNYEKVDYINKYTHVKIICLIHGEFEQSPSSHLGGSGCPKCVLKSQSKLFEKLSNNFPDEEILWECSPNWLGKQRFDIYLSKYNIAVEYNGEQHYRAIEVFGGDVGFLNTQERDRLKREKCIQNNCSLFELKYDYNENDYEKLITNIETIIKTKEKNEI